MKTKRSFFTLLEILTVLLILGAAASVVGIQVKEVYEEQRFLSEVTQVTNHLRTAQDLMLLLDNDVHFKMHYNQQGEFLEYWLESEKPIPGLSSVDEKKLQKKRLYGIRSYFFTPEPSEHNADLDILFSFGKTTSGSLILSPEKIGTPDDTPEGGKYEVVILKYPYPIESHLYLKKPPEMKETKSESENLYPVDE
jgi:type II secretory pathway pseudopilin PulG